MELSNILKIVVTGVAVVLIVVVLLQNRGGGLGTVFGGVSGGEYYRSRRGIEALLYNMTVILSIVFITLCLAIAIINA